ncbi:Receptor-type tyrosine-protein phosphatase kappa [Temnothorax longispinosus]|uniref:Receptor-type tyrosine-protein phosphatase kappa n=1 Tax=Temnothorax longispinosus TaxID=300112 RepID=A0A4S2KW42_9HYME|nr:Receptor-type tyrosine-protein phosphatase kappa [Temnothorax longispinosus]
MTLVQSYSCPAKWYFLVIRNINTNETVVSELAMSFPYKLQHLLSYTSFNVTIFHEDHVLFSKNIRTLEDVPAKVLDLHSWLIPILLFLVVSVAAFYLYTSVNTLDRARAVDANQIKF